MGFFDPDDDAGHARSGLRALPRRDRLVHRGPRGHGRPRARLPGADRLRRPALAPLAADAPRDDAPAGDAGAPDGGAHARRAGPARGHRQLAPDRPRMAVRRPALHRARRARGAASTPARPPDDGDQGDSEGGRGAARGRPGDGAPGGASTAPSFARTSGASAPATPTARCCARSSGQQLSTKAARTHLRAACWSCSAATRPRPKQLLAADPDEIRAAGLSRAEDRATCATSPSTSRSGELELDQLDELPDEEVIEQLTAVKGIGEWSAHMFLMFHLGRPDVLPVGDQGIRNAVQVAVPAAQDARRRSGSRRSPGPGARTGRWRASTSGAR